MEKFSVTAQFTTNVVSIVLVALFLLSSNAMGAQKTWVEPETGMEFVLVKGGCYQMGDVFGGGPGYTQPAHEVCVNDFYIGRYEVTQNQWQKIMGSSVSELRDKAGKDQPLYGVGDDLPIYYVSWDDADEFTRRLSRKSGKSFKLPTEAEWEYAARSGGKVERFAGGDEINDVAWHRDNSNGRPRKVGTKKANGLGIYDMSGNALEWTQDWYDNDYYKRSPRLNPQGPSFTSRNDRTFRGGSWLAPVRSSTTIYRGCNDPDITQNEMGFRVLLPAPEVL